MTNGAYIEYQNKGFWILEPFIEIISDFLCKTYESMEISKFNGNLMKIYHNCNANRTGVNIGMVNILLENYLVSQSDQATFVNILNQAKIIILSKGTEISISALNQFENNKVYDDYKGNWIFPVKTQSLISVLEILKELIAETYPYTNRYVHFQGFPDIGAEDTL